MLNLDIKTEYSQKELRAWFEINVVIPVKAFARRPKCKAQLDSYCKAQHGDTLGRGFTLTACGCVCHRCLYPNRPAHFAEHQHLFATQRASPSPIKRNRWRNYVRPSHNCACGKAIADTRSKHCKPCAAQQREAQKKSASNS